jgi:hypothetical protein
MVAELVPYLLKMIVLSQRAGLDQACIGRKLTSRTSQDNDVFETSPLTAQISQ